MDQEESLAATPGKQQNGFMMDLVKLALVIAVIAVGVIIFKLQINHPREAEQVETFKLTPKVSLSVVEVADYPVKITTQGRIEPVTRTLLISEVGGHLESVSPKLKPGMFFESDENFLKIADESYQARLSEVKAQVADARLSLELEMARAEQSMRDWLKLGRGGEPSKLVTREPQLTRARASLAAAEAAEVKAQKDLKMTVPTMPYAARVEEAFIDRGAYLAPGGQIAWVYAADKVELRLPLSLEDFSYLAEPLEGTEVVVTSAIGNENLSWKGKLVRTEGRIDPNTLTMMAVVEITKEAGENARFALPPVGLFVQGSFQGKVLEDVVRVKRSAVRGEDLVWVCNAKNQLEIRKVKILRSEHGYVVIGGGLAHHERVVVSPIDLPVAGMSLEPVGEVE